MKLSTIGIILVVVALVSLLCFAVKLQIDTRTNKRNALLDAGFRISETEFRSSELESFIMFDEPNEFIEVAKENNIRTIYHGHVYGSALVFEVPFWFKITEGVRTTIYILRTA